jgi:hypothetical protein
MTTDEPFDCDICRRRIGANTTHLITENGVVCHVGCAERRTTHDAVYPDCPLRWHDLWDHGLVHGSRGGARLWLKVKGLTT